MSEFVYGLATLIFILLWIGTALAMFLCLKSSFDRDICGGRMTRLRAGFIISWIAYALILYWLGIILWERWR